MLSYNSLTNPHMGYGTLAMSNVALPIKEGIALWQWNVPMLSIGKQRTERILHVAIC
jgi:hypothetical protein